MELRHLRCFIALAEELHFTRAAERLHIEQPLFPELSKSLRTRWEQSSLIGIVEAQC